MPSNNSSQLAAYPCDRGIPNNVLARGYHNFAYTGGPAAVCTLCGAVSAHTIVSPTKGL